MRFDLSQYETVEQRLAKFWEQYPNGQVFTSVHYYDENRVVFRAELYKDISDPRPVSTGHAEEVRDASPVNRTSHVENAETSAIGRALANYVFQSKTSPRPSREEMAKVVRAQEKPADNFLVRFTDACNRKGIKAEDVAASAGVDLTALDDEAETKLRQAFKNFTPTSKEVEQAEQFIEKIKEAFPDASVVKETPQIKEPDSPATKSQIGKARALLSGKGVASYNDKLEKAQELLNMPNLKQFEQLTKGQANLLIKMIEEMR